MGEPFFTEELLARIVAAGAHTGFEYYSEVVPSNCLPGATIDSTSPWTGTYTKV